MEPLDQPVPQPEPGMRVLRLKDRWQTLQNNKQRDSTQSVQRLRRLHSDSETLRSLVVSPNLARRQSELTREQISLRRLAGRRPPPPGLPPNVAMAPSHAGSNMLVLTRSASMPNTPRARRRSKAFNSVSQSLSRAQRLSV